MGPNPWKTVIILEELNLPYSATYLDFGDSKGGVEHEEFLKKNPAGRVPLINDPNTGKSVARSTTELSQELTSYRHLVD
jgi:glutathione S-transferase